MSIKLYEVYNRDSGLKVKLDDSLEYFTQEEIERIGFKSDNYIIKEVTDA